MILLDAEDRVLLVRGTDPARPGSSYWFTLGGGVDPGEGHAQAAARELREEAGLSVEPQALGDVVLAEVAEFPYAGQWYRQEQVFFLMRVPSWEVPAGLDPVHVIDIHEHRWWSVADLESTEEEFYPPTLAQVLRRLGRTRR